jgi:hypothetical protein
MRARLNDLRHGSTTVVVSTRKSPTATMETAIAAPARILVQQVASHA